MGSVAWPTVVSGVSRNSFRVRAAGDADIPEVLFIEQASFADPWSADAFISSLNSGQMRFLVVDELDASSGASTVVGYVIALVITSEAEIAAIAVAVPARGRGVGGVLLDQMTSDLRDAGVETLYLEVRESNAVARALYASRAFKEVGRRRRYYRLPVEDALILRREFAPT